MEISVICMRNSTISFTETSYYIPVQSTMNKIIMPSMSIKRKATRVATVRINKDALNVTT